MAVLSLSMTRAIIRKLFHGPFRKRIHNLWTCETQGQNCERLFLGEHQRPWFDASKHVMALLETDRSLDETFAISPSEKGQRSQFYEKPLTFPAILWVGIAVPPPPEPERPRRYTQPDGR